VLVIRRTLAEGRLIGLVSGLGAATADALYGLVAALGLSAVSAALISVADPLRIIGGLFLAWLGWRTLRSKPAERAAETASTGGAYLSTLALTLTNPMTMLAFLGIFAALSDPTRSAQPANTLLMAVGIATGSALWWLLLSAGVSLLRQRITSKAMRAINLISGAVILLFALHALLSG
jgi:threonine/homoserine/homoserine lactone efflux protein